MPDEETGNFDTPSQPDHGVYDGRPHQIPAVLRCYLHTDARGIITSGTGALEDLLGKSEVTGLQLADSLRFIGEKTGTRLDEILAFAKQNSLNLSAYIFHNRCHFTPVRLQIAHQGHDVFLITVTSAYQQAVESFTVRQSQVLELIATGKPLEMILTRLVLLIESVLPETVGTILLLSADRESFQESIAPSLPAEYGEQLRGIGIGPEVGSCGAALYSGHRIISTDIRNDPKWEKYLHLVIPHGLKACWSTPFFSEEKESLGTFGIYHRECHSPEPHELAILDAASHLAAVAVTHHRNILRFQRAADFQTHLLDTFPALVWRADSQGNAIYFNVRWLAFTGGSQETEQQKGWLSGVHPEDREGINKIYSAALLAKEPFLARYRLCRHDGVFRWVETHALPFAGLDGQFAGFIGSGQDITEAVNAEAEIKEYNRQFHEMLQNVHLIAVMLDRNGNITFCNDFLLRLTGWRSEEILGKCWFELFVPHIPKVREMFLQSISEDTIPDHYENEIQTKDGRLLSIAWNNTLNRDAGGNIIGTTSIGEDITARKESEARLQRLNRLYAVSSSVNETIVRLREPQKLFEEACRIAVERGLLRMAWVGLIDADGERLKPVAIWGHEANYLTLFQVSLKDPESNSGPACQAIFSRKPVVSNDITTDTIMSPWREEAAARGYRSVAAFPLHVSGRAVGAIMMYADISGYFDDEVVNVLYALAENISFAVESAEKTAERQQALQALEENQRVLSTLLSNLVGMAYRCQLDEFWTMEFVSDGCLALTGYSPEELAYNKRTSYEEIIHPDDRQKVRDDVEEALQQGQQFDINYRITTAQGENRWVWERGVGILKPDGSLEALEGFIVDVTERRHQEMELRKIQMAVENASDCIAITTPEGQSLFYNRAFRELLGYSAEGINILGDRETIFVIPELRNKILHNLHQGHPWAGDVQIFDREHKLLDFHLRATPIQDDQGKIVALMGIFTDISERTLAHQKITEQAALLDQAQDAIITRDLQGKIIYWNQGAARMYGWQSEEAVGRLLTDLIYHDRTLYLSAMEKLLAEGNWSGEQHHFSRTGRELTVESRWTLLRNASGKPCSILAINTDITEKKRLENQFFRAQRMESIGTLAGGIAHDLNNVLAPIIMSIDLLRSSATNESDLELLNLVENSAKRGADLVRQVLSFARGVEGHHTAINPAMLIRDTIKIALETFPKSIQVTSEISAGLWMVAGEPTQLHQVLLNLAVNARDAMPEGGQLTLRATNTVLDGETAANMDNGIAGNFVCISVADTGTGIPVTIQDKIFEPFFTTKALGKGTGLGLSTVMAIVKSHGGFIHLASESGKGSIFHVYLPQASQKSQPAKENQMPLMRRGNGECILVVDDESSVRNVLKNTLQTFGYTVLTADNGAVALDVFSKQKERIRAVISDIMMPVMDGPTALAQIRIQSPELPLIAVSGLNENMNVGKAVSAGVNCFLAKPYATDVLLQTLYDLLNKDH